jgi:hypothetical protein
MPAFVDVQNSGFVKKQITVPIPKKYSMQSIFTSNVFYKPGTNSSVSGTVRNARRVTKHT